MIEITIGEEFKICGDPEDMVRLLA